MNSVCYFSHDLLLTKHVFPLSFVGLFNNFTLIIAFDDISAGLFVIIMKPETLLLESFDRAAAESSSLGVGSSVL